MADLLFGPPPSYPDVDRGPIVLGAYWSFTAISLIVLGLRFWARTKIRALGADDWVMAVAVLLFIALTIAGTKMVLVGGCRHLWYLVHDGGTVNLRAVVPPARFFYVAQPFALMGVVMARVSVGLLLLRILGHSSHSPVRRTIIWCCIVSTAVFGALNSIIIFVSCRPPEANWDPFIKGANCWDPKIATNITIGFSAWNVFVDFVLALLPVTIFWRLQLSLRKRIGLILLMSGGVFAGVSGAVKAADLPKSNLEDVTWALYDLLMWHGAENFLVIVLGSVPTLKPIYDMACHRLAPKGSSADRSRTAQDAKVPKDSWGSGETASTAVGSQSAAPKAHPTSVIRPMPSGISVSHRVDVERWDDGQGWPLREVYDRVRDVPYGGWERDDRRVEIRGPSRLGEV